MRKRQNLIEACMRHHKLMLLFVGVMVLLGDYGVYDMPKQEFPIFTIRQGVIVAV